QPFRVQAPSFSPGRKADSATEKREAFPFPQHCRLRVVSGHSLMMYKSWQTPRWEVSGPFQAQQNRTRRTVPPSVVKGKGRAVLARQRHPADGYRIVYPSHNRFRQATASINEQGFSLAQDVRPTSIRMRRNEARIGI